MSDTPQLTIEIKLDNGDVVKGLAKLPEHFKPIGKKAGEELGEELKSGMEGKTEDIVSGLKSKLLGLGAILGSVFTAGAAISEAAEEEEAVSRLNAALTMSGVYSKKASKGLQDFASEMQNTTRYSDDAILSTAAYIESLTNLDVNGLRRATEASADLATLLRVDISTASNMVARAAEGNVVAFGKMGISIKEGSTNAETFANALEAIETKAHGLSKMDLNSFNGLRTFDGNMIKNTLGALGDFFVKNPIVLSMMKTIGERFGQFSEGISKAANSNEWSDKISQGLLRICDAGILAIRPFELLYNAIEMLKQASTKSATGNASVGFFEKILGVSPEAAVKINLALEVMGLGLTKTAEKALTAKTEGEGFLASLTKTSPATDSLRALRDEFVKNAEEMQAAKKKAEETPSVKAYSASDETINVMAIVYAEKSRLMAEERQQVADNLAMWIDAQNYLCNVWNGMGDAFSKSARKLMLTSKEMSQKIADNLMNGIANGAANAFASFGKALAEGDNALKAFGKSFLATFGQMAVQLGSMFMLQGACYLFVPGMEGLGAGLIAAGAALAVFGGVMSAFGGSGASTSSSSGGAPSSYSETETNKTTAPTVVKEEKQEPKTTVQVNIHGSVYDSQETGLRIVELMNEAINKNGARVYA